jgi:hypothetical protein
MIHLSRSRISPSDFPSLAQACFLSFFSYLSLSALTLSPSLSDALYQSRRSQSHTYEMYRLSTKYPNIVPLQCTCTVHVHLRTCSQISDTTLSFRSSVKKSSQSQVSRLTLDKSNRHKFSSLHSGWRSANCPIQCRYHAYLFRTVLVVLHQRLPTRWPE